MDLHSSRGWNGGRAGTAEEVGSVVEALRLAVGEGTDHWTAARAGLSGAASAAIDANTARILEGSQTTLGAGSWHTQAEPRVLHQVRNTGGWHTTSAQWRLGGGTSNAGQEDGYHLGGGGDQVGSNRLGTAARSRGSNGQVPRWNEVGEAGGVRQDTPTVVDEDDRPLGTYWNWQELGSNEDGMREDGNNAGGTQGDLHLSPAERTAVLHGPLSRGRGGADRRLLRMDHVHTTATNAGSMAATGKLPRLHDTVLGQTGDHNVKCSSLQVVQKSRMGRTPQEAERGWLLHRGSEGDEANGEDVDRNTEGQRYYEQPVGTTIYWICADCGDGAEFFIVQIGWWGCRCGQLGRSILGTTWT